MRILPQFWAVFNYSTYYSIIEYLMLKLLNSTRYSANYSWVLDTVILWQNCEFLENFVKDSHNFGTWKSPFSSKHDSNYMSCKFWMSSEQKCLANQNLTLFLVQFWYSRYSGYSTFSIWYSTDFLRNYSTRLDTRGWSTRDTR